MSSAAHCHMTCLRVIDGIAALCIIFKVFGTGNSTLHEVVFCEDLTESGLIASRSHIFLKRMIAQRKINNIAV